MRLCALILVMSIMLSIGCIFLSCSLKAGKDRRQVLQLKEQSGKDYLEKNLQKNGPEEAEIIVSAWSRHTYIINEERDRWYPGYEIVSIDKLAERELDIVWKVRLRKPKKNQSALGE